MNFEGGNQCFPDAKLLHNFWKSSWSICIANTCLYLSTKENRGIKAQTKLHHSHLLSKSCTSKDKLTKDNLLHVLQSRTWIAYKLRTMRPSWRCLKALWHTTTDGVSGALQHFGYTTPWDKSSSCCGCCRYNSCKDTRFWKVQQAAQKSHTFTHYCLFSESSCMLSKHQLHIRKTNGHNRHKVVRSTYGARNSAKVDMAPTTSE